MKYSFLTLHTSPLFTPLFAAPFGSRIFFANFTGFVMTPVSILFGALFSLNTVILANLILSALGMFLLARHLTKSSSAGIIAGIAFGFCTNLLVRSYTTFDTTQVQWIPFYTLFVIRFIENRTWKNALLAGLFLACNILLASPYYLVYLPIHTIVLLLVYAVWHARGEKRGVGGLARDLFSRQALGGWIRSGAAFLGVIIVFGIYYTVFVGGSASATYAVRSTAELEELSLIPADYLVPHPRSALLKGDFKETYWDAVPRPEKNSDSNVAYIGYIALVLAILGLIRGRKGPEKWFFFFGAAVAFWATLGPTLLGLPTPTWLIHKYAPFARRILLYKAYVQFGMAGLAGLGAAFLVPKLRSRTQEAVFTGLIALGMLLEYAIVPPFLSVNLANTPEVYERARALPGDAKLIEVPLRRANGNLYQGYVYYQTHHHKPLFNPYMGVTGVSERIQPFYRQMEPPLEAASYSNLAALRHLGITHLIHHYAIQTRTVQFRSFDDAPFTAESIEGLNRVFEGPRRFESSYESPYDYTFADLYEITAEPSPAALIFDYHTPFEPYAGHQGQDGMIPFGWYSALFDPEATFYYPLAKEARVERVMKGAGKISVVNLSDQPVTVGVRFTAYAPDARTLEVRWQGNPAGTFPIGPTPTVFEAAGLSLAASGAGDLTITASGAPFDYSLAVGQGSMNLPATAVFTDVRVVK
jgi:hypothetical protein